MKILLTDGSGLTARQVAHQLAQRGHDVGIVTADPLCLARFTRATRRWHRVPPFGRDPLGWLDAALRTYREHGYELLFPTQEMVTVLASQPARLDTEGVVTAVPPFASLVTVQDKISAHETLDRLDLPQPPAEVIADPGSVMSSAILPAWVKTPIGTATSGAFLAHDQEELHELLRSGVLDEGFDDGGVLVQAPVDGPLLMVQSVFDHGRLVAFHANERTAAGARGGASRKTSVRCPEARQVVQRLGEALTWHGGLSADVILTADGPTVIDVNPRLVEPGNALASGTDLVGAMLDVALSREPPEQPDGAAGVATHQRLLGVLGAAQRGEGRRGILRELCWGRCGRGSAASTEELTPDRRDPWSVALVASAAAVSLASPAAWSWFSSGSVAAYALTPSAWRTIRARAERSLGPAPPTG